MKDIIGHPIDKDGNIIEYKNPLQYYHECKNCKKLVDRRNLTQVVLHESNQCELIVKGE